MQDDYTIVAYADAGITGHITVSTPGGTAASAETFTFMPIIDSFDPTSGQAGTLVNIVGVGFTGATAVTIGGYPAVFTVNSYSSISATAGNGATGSISVTTPVGTATSADTFTYLPAQLTGVSIAASPASPQYAGTAITLTAAALGSGIGTANVQYQFKVQYQQANGSWTAPTMLSDWSTSASCVWSATDCHKYALLVYACPVGNPANVVTSYLTFTLLPSNLTGVTLSANPPAPQYIGTPITLTAAAQGGIAPGDVEYQFVSQYKQADGSWSPDALISDWSTNPRCTWTPATAENYYVSVYARPLDARCPLPSPIISSIRSCRPTLPG